MRDRMAMIILETLEEACQEQGMEMLWEAPVVKFADARDAGFVRLKELVGEAHYLPRDYLADAASVLTYFLPFRREIGRGNQGGELASAAWAEAYLVTNRLFPLVNGALIRAIETLGFSACQPTDAGMISLEEPSSRWSQRHVAHLAGHGTFGLNNMLISDRGCMGRYGSIVTTLPVDPDPIPTEERCLYKARGICGLCAERCVVGALRRDGFDRMKCLAQCMVNDAKYPGADVCGKCMVELPCSHMMK